MKVKEPTGKDEKGKELGGMALCVNHMNENYEPGANVLR
jgi:hypothetical protein